MNSAGGGFVEKVRYGKGVCREGGSLECALHVIALQVLVELRAHVVDVLCLKGEPVHGAQAPHRTLRPRQRVLEHRALELDVS